jgi:hypothetical protein
MQQVNNARQISVDQKKMPMNTTSNPPPPTQTVMQPEQTVTRQRRLSDASPEELSAMGQTSADIFGGEEGREALQSKAAIASAAEQQKSKLDTEREIAVEKQRGLSGVQTQAERNKAIGKHSKQFQDYLDTYGNEEDALKHMIDDGVRLRKAGVHPAGGGHGELLKTEDDKNGVPIDYFGIKGVNGAPDKVLYTQAHHNPPAAKKDPKAAIGKFMDLLNGKGASADSAKVGTQAAAAKPKTAINRQTGEKAQYNESTGQWETIQK